ncbi:MAG: DUF1854 domain-containing protein [Capsulimonadales bacterium]|nr:DUF1854 domain-containing protein [Capsulimonadales bacterium]
METIPPNVAASDPTSGERSPADTSIELVFLDPSRVVLFRTGGAAVRATVTDPVIGAERTFLSVRVARAFPLDRPNEYIGLRDEKDKDIGMLRKPDGLDEASRKLLDEELERRYFIPKVTRVVDVKEEGGMVTWEVETDKGPRTFIVQGMRDSLFTIGKDRFLLADKDGVRYEFPDLGPLRRASPGKAGDRALALLSRTSTPN